MLLTSGAVVTPDDPIEVQSPTVGGLVNRLASLETPVLEEDGVMPGNTTQMYPPVLQERAVRMVAEIRQNCQ
jgi:hypothetical protein